MRSRFRSLLARAQASTAARKRTLVGLVAVPLAGAFVAGTVLGVVAERGGWGIIAVLACIPVAVAGGAIVGRALFGAAQSVRRTHGAMWMRDQLRPLELTVTEQVPRRVNVVHLALDFKHFFGGFIAIFNLARRLGERGHRVRLIALEESEIPADWRAQLARYEGLGELAAELEVAPAANRAQAIEANPQDLLIATSWAAAHVSAAALSELEAERFLYLIQEYEPYFSPMGSAAALARHSYDLPHAALFSTDLLRKWFAANRVGVFAAGPDAGERDSVSFDNAITPVGPVGVEELRRSGPRRLLFYARPEEHASRNMFELGVMALDAAVASGRFSGWALDGVGTVELRGGSLPLTSSGAELRLIPRGSQADYARLLRSYDVGLALMYTPHPGLVAIEMAAAGMATVTNTFENRDAAAMTAISSNLIPAEPSVEGVVEALLAAEARASELERRAQGSHVKWPASWDEALGDEVLARVERLLAIQG
jgi:hypothetical protein